MVRERYQGLVSVIDCSFLKPFFQMIFRWKELGIPQPVGPPA
jgi:hypothetical protein